MTKEDLKTGMWVELRNGSKYLVVENMQTAAYDLQELVFIRNTGFMVGKNYDNSMCDIDKETEYDIVKVWKSPATNLSGPDYHGCNKPGWVRDESKVRLTLKQIADKFGINVERIVIEAN